MIPIIQADKPPYDKINLKVIHKPPVLTIALVILVYFYK